MWFYLLSIFEAINIYRRKFGNYEIVVPGQVSPMTRVPDSICAPSYSKTGIPFPSPTEAEIKNKKQIHGMRQSCRLARDVLDLLQPVVKVGD